MDIKLGGREMATVVYSNEEDDICSLVIDGCCGLKVKVKNIDKEIGIYCPVCGRS